MNGSKECEFTLEEIPSTITMTLGVSSWKNASHPARKTGPAKETECKPKRKSWVTHKSAWSLVIAWARLLIQSGNLTCEMGLLQGTDRCSGNPRVWLEGDAQILPLLLERICALTSISPTACDTGYATGLHKRLSWALPCEESAAQPLERVFANLTMNYLYDRDKGRKRRRFLLSAVTHLDSLHPTSHTVRRWGQNRGLRRHWPGETENKTLN